MSTYFPDDDPRSPTSRTGPHPAIRLEHCEHARHWTGEEVLLLTVVATELRRLGMLPMGVCARQAIHSYQNRNRPPEDKREELVQAHADRIEKLGLAADPEANVARCRARLSFEEVREIAEQLADGVTYVHLRAEHGVSNATITAIATGAHRHQRTEAA